MRCAYLRLGGFKIGALAGAAGCFFVWKCREFLAAMRADLCDSRLAPWCAFVGLVRAGAGAILAGRLLSFPFKAFAADRADADRVFLFVVGSVAVIEAIGTAIFFLCARPCFKWPVAG